MHQFGGNRPRRRPHNHENQQPASPLSALQGLLPLLLLFLLPLLSSIFSGSGPSGPSVRFDAAVPPHTQMHTSGGLKVPYYVDPREVEDYSTKKWRELDKIAEGKFVGQLSAECEYEQGGYWFHSVSFPTLIVWLQGYGNAWRKKLKASSTPTKSSSTRREIWK